MRSLILPISLCLLAYGTLCDQSVVEEGLYEGVDKVNEVVVDRTVDEPAVLSRDPRSAGVRKVLKKRRRKNDQEEEDDDSQMGPIATKILRKKIKGKNGEPLPEKKSRFFSLFTVVRFANDPCQSSSGNNGTCYTSSDCSSRGGKSEGSCAGGFGVCCFFEFMCGKTTAENSTYFTNPSTPQRICNLMVERNNDEICQIRLELDTFDIAGPNTKGECDTDSFIVTGGSAVPQICGLNNNQHLVYSITPSSGPTQLSMIIDPTTTATSSSRTWHIRVYQYECSSPNLAPVGCLQYYTGASGILKSFNYKTDVPTTDGTNQIANTRYSICIRMDHGFCGIRYSQSSTDTYSFTLTGDATIPGQMTFPLPQNSEKLGDANCRADYLVIPGGSQTGETDAFTRDRYCGLGLGHCPFSPTAMTGACTSQLGPVISMVQPFIVSVVTDADEGQGTVKQSVSPDKGNRGFYLTYSQLPCLFG